MRAQWLALALLLIGLMWVAPASSGKADDSEDAKLAAKFQAFLDEEFRQRPSEATRLGDHRFDDRLDDLSPKARAAWVERWKTTLADLEKTIDRKRLTRSSQIDLDIFRHSLTYNLWQAENSRA